MFDGLNRFLRELMMAALEGRGVNPTVLPAGLHAAVYSNPATRGLANSLHGALVGLNLGQKHVLRDELLLNPDPCNFLTDRALALPTIPGTVFPHLKALAVHLYQRTAKLVDVEVACGECIDDHYARFRAAAAPGNGNVCCVCGTESLAQVQAGVDANEQWRGPYDHLLAKDDYPLFGVHPGNLLPICHTCNSKAKLAKDLLLKNGHRRLSFSPWAECALPEEIQVTIDDTDIFPRVVVDFQGQTTDRQEKLDTWDEVFKIKARVEGEFAALPQKVVEDVKPGNQASFPSDLLQCVKAKAAASRSTPFNYWRARVYHAIQSMDVASREALRCAIQQHSPPAKVIKDVFNV